MLGKVTFFKSYEAAGSILSQIFDVLLSILVAGPLGMMMASEFVLELF